MEGSFSPLWHIALQRGERGKGKEVELEIRLPTAPKIHQIGLRLLDYKY
jgi:hypothetical protein